MCTGQQVDMYTKEIKSLVVLAIYSGEWLVRTFSLRFMTVFPGSISEVLVQLANIRTASLSEPISCARVLTSGEVSNLDTGCQRTS